MKVVVLEVIDILSFEGRLNWFFNVLSSLADDYFCWTR